MKTPKYDAMYFLNKFYAIPEKRWCTGGYNDSFGRSCALGHCGYRWRESFSSLDKTNEGIFLNNLFYDELHSSVISVNDGDGNYKKLGDTPKERIINALLLINAGVEL